MSRLCVFLIATCLLAVTPRLFGDIILVSRLSDAEARAFWWPPTQSQTGFLPANLCNSDYGFHAMGNNVTAHSTSNSSILINDPMEGLRIVSDGTVSASVGSFGGNVRASAKLIVLSFTVTGAPYPYTMTGQLTGANCSSACSKATAKLTGETGTIFEKVGTTLSESGTLPPGNYTLSVDVFAQISSTQPASTGTDANFTFTLDGPMSTPTPTPTPTPVTRATNLSTRLLVYGIFDGQAIGGFIITGNGPRHLLIRGIGPSLSGVLANALPDPSLYLQTVVINCLPQTLFNDNWRDRQEAEIIGTGRAPGNDLESAIVVDLTPGSYTVFLRGNADPTGVGLVEIYDLSTNQDSKLANLSTRGKVGTGDEIMIAGFILGGASGEDSIILRGIGPSLSEAFPQLSGLPDPKLELRNSQGALIASNDNWMDDPNQAAIIQAAGLAPTNNLESAIAATLMPGNYTALLSGVNNGTGVGLVEVYELGAPAHRPSNFSDNFEYENCVIPRESAKW
jgi:hypothetical protein